MGMGTVDTKARPEGLASDLDQMFRTKEFFYGWTIVQLTVWLSSVTKNSELSPGL